MNFIQKLLPRSRKQKAIDEYNLGLAAKYEGNWAESYAHNKRASELNSEDQATWWNLGIAATVLRDWPAAREAWSKCGIQLEPGTGETRWDEVWACVRLNSKDNAEVVWGFRLDPCRIRIMNVPLPESNRRYGDIILADGAQNGTRMREGHEYPVFDELEVWSESPYSTFEAKVMVPNAEAMERLVNCIEQEHCSVEDWDTLRNLCKVCSEGQPGEHTCSTQSVESRFGFAARSETELQAAIAAWLRVETDAFVGLLHLRLAAAERQ